MKRRVKRGSLHLRAAAWMVLSSSCASVCPRVAVPPPELPMSATAMARNSRRLRHSTLCGPRLAAGRPGAARWRPGGS